MNETSYVDDNTPYVTGDGIEDVTNSLENESDNQMKANKGKCHLLISCSENITINVEFNIIGKSI